MQIWMTTIWMEWLSLLISSYSQLEWRRAARTGFGCWGFGWDSGGMWTVVPRHVSAEATRYWHFPEIVHSSEGLVANGSCGSRVYTGAAWMVGNMETTICGKIKLIQKSTSFITLKKWIFIFKTERESYKFKYLRKVMLSLLESRRELLGATLTQDQTLELQMKVISKIDWGNR